MAYVNKNWGQINGGNDEDVDDDDNDRNDQIIVVNSVELAIAID